jgi:hypothetical protein
MVTPTTPKLSDFFLIGQEQGPLRVYAVMTASPPDDNCDEFSDAARSGVTPSAEWGRSAIWVKSRGVVYEVVSRNRPRINPS